MAGPPLLNKADLRRDLRRLRRAQAERLGAAEALANIALAEIDFPKGVVGGYWPHGSEIDPVPLMAALAACGHDLALPVIQGEALAFRLWRPDDPLDRGAHGISVPREAARLVEPATLLIPLLGFDRTGHRLGQGAGYYDRRLEALRPQLAIGVAFAIQEVERLPAERHDQLMDMIVTERGVIRVRSAD